MNHIHIHWLNIIYLLAGLVALYFVSKGKRKYAFWSFIFSLNGTILLAGWVTEQNDNRVYLPLGFMFTVIYFSLKKI